MQDKRLFAILNEVDRCDTLADVGTDHGLLCLLALKGERANRVIATDISAKSLQKAIDLLTEEGYSDVSEFRCGDGLSVLNPKDADVIVISGMGGGEIIGMINQSDEFESKFVLSPQSDVRRVRETLIRNGYRITKDYIVKSYGKFYDIISAVRGACEYSEDEYEFGRDNLKGLSPDFKEWLEKEREKASNLSRSVKSDSARDRFKERERKLLSLNKEIYGG